jgi:hypothetical protein
MNAAGSPCVLIINLVKELMGIAGFNAGPLPGRLVASRIGGGKQVHRVFLTQRYTHSARDEQNVTLAISVWMVEWRSLDYTDSMIRSVASHRPRGRERCREARVVDTI